MNCKDIECQGSVGPYSGTLRPIPGHNTNILLFSPGAVPEHYYCMKSGLNMILKYFKQCHASMNSATLELKHRYSFWKE